MSLAIWPSFADQSSYPRLRRPSRLSVKALGSDSREIPLRYSMYTRSPVCSTFTGHIGVTPSVNVFLHKSVRQYVSICTTIPASDSQDVILQMGTVFAGEELIVSYYHHVLWLTLTPFPRPSLSSDPAPKTQIAKDYPPRDQFEGPVDSHQVRSHWTLYAIVWLDSYLTL